MDTLRSMCAFLCGYQACVVLLGSPWAARCLSVCCCALVGVNVLYNSLPSVACYGLVRAMSHAYDML